MEAAEDILLVKEALPSFIHKRNKNKKVSTTSYDVKADVWSVGIVFFEMFHGPFGTRMERVRSPCFFMRIRGRFA